MPSAIEMAEHVRSGKTTATALVEACLKRIAERESVIGAWAYLDPELALRQAEQADRRVRAGAPLGALHGVPVGIKDIFDTADMPTENGTVLHAGRTPAEDAAAVALLRAAGAVIMGKTTTTELAVYTPDQDAQPASSGAHAGRLVERLGGGGGRWDGAARHRLADQRLGRPAGRLLRRLRLQADARASFRSRARWRSRGRSTRPAYSPTASRTRPSSPSRS